jgi:hypothetical protein
MSTNMLTKRALYVARMRGYVPSGWRGWLLVPTVPAYLASIVAGFVVAGDAGASVSAALIVAVTAACLALDWRGFLTLGGHITWRRPGWRWLFVLAYLALFIAPAVVLWQQVRAANQARRAAIAARPQQIAQLERSLGLDGPPPPERV